MTVVETHSVSTKHRQVEFRKSSRFFFDKLEDQFEDKNTNSISVKNKLEVFGQSCVNVVDMKLLLVPDNFNH